MKKQVHNKESEALHNFVAHLKSEFCFTKFSTLLLLFVFIILISITNLNLASAGKPHGISGFVFISEDGTDPNGANVTFYLENAPEDKLYDIVGSKGNSRVDYWYSIDIGNFNNNWSIGDIVVIEIFKDPDHIANTKVKLSNFGYDLAPELQLKSSGNFTNIVNKNKTKFSGYCGNKVCQQDVGETLKNCPLDCRPICGNLKCEEFENQENCCIDCRCKQFVYYGQIKCVKNSCVSCCLFGFCKSFELRLKKTETKIKFKNLNLSIGTPSLKIKICWFWLVVIIIVLTIILLIALRKKRKNICF